MELTDAPPGWRFCTADFSVLASGGAKPGRVVLVRDPVGSDAWHALPDEEKERDDGPALYVYGWGMTLDQAMQDAKRCALDSTPLAAERLNSAGAAGRLTWANELRRAADSLLERIVRLLPTTWRP